MLDRWKAFLDKHGGEIFSNARKKCLIHTGQRGRQSMNLTSTCRGASVRWFLLIDTASPRRGSRGVVESARQLTGQFSVSLKNRAKPRYGTSRETSEQKPTKSLD